MSRLAILLVAAFAFLLSSVKADGPSDVVVLTPDNFDDLVLKDNTAFVEFYAPWCGHCKALAPEYEIVGSAFKKTDGVVVGKVDCDSHKDLCSRFGVSGYPTLKIFEANSETPKDYSGGRNADEIISFINKHAGTKVKVVLPKSDVLVLDPQNFDSVVMDSSKDVLVEFYAPWCGHCKNLAPVWEKLSIAFKNEPNVVVANCDADKHKELATKFGISGFPTIKFFPKDKKAGEAYDGGRKLEDFVEFLNKKAGTARTADGLLDAKAGRVDALDALALKFAAAPAKDRAGILAELEGVIKDLSEAEAGYGKVYSKIMNAAIKKGADYLTKEAERLKRLLSGSVVANKVDEFTLKKNILEAFSATAES